MRIAHKALVVVADGRKMLVFRNDGDAGGPQLTIERKDVQDNPPQRDQGTDTPGRAAGGVGSARSAFSETDFHQLEEDRFAADVADQLKVRALRNDYAELVVVAPPRTLGEMRKHYHKEVSKRLIGELAKDLTGHPVDEIEKLLIAAD